MITRYAPARAGGPVIINDSGLAAALTFALAFQALPAGTLIGVARCDVGEALLGENSFPSWLRPLVVTGAQSFTTNYRTLN